MSSDRTHTVIYRPGSRRALREVHAVTGQQLQDLDTIRTVAMEMVEALQQELRGRQYTEQSVGGDDPARALDRIARTVRQCILLERRLLGLDPPPRERNASEAPKTAPTSEPPASDAQPVEPSLGRLAAERAETLDEDILDDFSDLKSLEGLIADMDDEEIVSHGWKDRADALLRMRALSGQKAEPQPVSDDDDDPDALMSDEEIDAILRSREHPAIEIKSAPTPFDRMAPRDLMALFQVLAARYKAATTDTARALIRLELDPCLAAVERLTKTIPPPDPPKKSPTSPGSSGGPMNQQPKH